MEHTEKKSPLYFTVGLIVIVLALTGLFTVVGFIGDKAQSSIDKNRSEQIKIYEDFIAPVIMNDPETFDDITMADMEQLISISVWSVIGDGADPEKYEYTDGGLLLPEKEVEEKFVSLFGSEVAPVHSSADGGEGVEFKYSKKKKCYIIPITGISQLYLPDVTDYQEKDNSVILEVGYLASSDWVQDESGNMVPPEAAKNMKITLGKNSDGSFFVKAVQSAD